MTRRISLTLAGISLPLGVCLLLIEELSFRFGCTNVLEEVHQPSWLVKDSAWPGKLPERLTHVVHVQDVKYIDFWLATREDARTKSPD